MGKFSDAILKSEKEKSQGAVDLSRIPDIEDADHNRPGINTGIPVGAIGNRDHNIDEKIISFHLPGSYEAEQFRLLKTGLIFSVKNKIPKTIMVTSAEPDDGKSFIASNLAVTFAQSLDSHVVLMDCDLRNSTVHKIFGIPDSHKGLSDWLDGDISFQSILHKTQIDKFSIIPGGKRPVNPSEMLSSAKMIDLLDELKSRYTDRYIIIDTPPPLLTAEAIALSTLVDGILIVVKHEKTSRKSLKKLIEVIGEEKILGVILNQYDVRTEKYYGSSNYGKYYNKRSI